MPNFGGQLRNFVPMTSDWSHVRAWLHVHVHVRVTTKHCERAGANPRGVYACACAVACGQQHLVDFQDVHVQYRQAVT